MLACGHDDSGAYGAAICSHLLGQREGFSRYFRWFTGRGVETELLCAECVELRKRDESVALAEPVCEECFTFVIHEIKELCASCGRTEIRERPLPFGIALLSNPLPRDWGEIADFAPVDAEAGSLWILLSESGQLIRFDADNGEARWLAATEVPREAEREPWCGHVLHRRLHVSRHGDFAAVVNDFGRFGEILNLRSGASTSKLDGGDYFAGTVPFSFAFAETADGRTLAVHRADWNRLDLSDAATGELLSRRSPERLPSWERKPEERTGPVADRLFHGRLAPSPDGRLLLEDGWIWHPVGMPRVFSLESWLSYPWEPEDGASCRELCWRSDYFHSSLVWLDANRLAVGGIGEHESPILPGARIFDLREEGSRLFDRSIALPGPAGELFSDGESLFSAGPGGLSRWDLTDGCRTGHLPGFEPSRHHRGAWELAQLSEGRLVRWKMA